MTLHSSGSISLGQLRNEAGLTGSVNLGNHNIRMLLGVPGGSIALSQGYGKSLYRSVGPCEIRYINPGDGGRVGQALSWNRVGPGMGSKFLKLRNVSSSDQVVTVNMYVYCAVWDSATYDLCIVNPDNIGEIWGIVASYGTGHIAENSSFQYGWDTAVTVPANSQLTLNVRGYWNSNGDYVYNDGAVEIVSLTVHGRSNVVEACPWPVTSSVNEYRYNYNGFVADGNYGVTPAILQRPGRPLAGDGVFDCGQYFGALPPIGYYTCDLQSLVGNVDISKSSYIGNVTMNVAFTLEHPPYTSESGMDIGVQVYKEGDPGFALNTSVISVGYTTDNVTGVAISNIAMSNYNTNINLSKNKENNCIIIKVYFTKNGVPVESAGVFTVYPGPVALTALNVTPLGFY